MDFGKQQVGEQERRQVTGGSRRLRPPPPLAAAAFGRHRTRQAAGVEEVSQLSGEGAELLHKGLRVLACRGGQVGGQG